MNEYTLISNFFYNLLYIVFDKASINQFSCNPLLVISEVPWIKYSISNNLTLIYLLSLLELLPSYLVN